MVRSWSGWKHFPEAEYADKIDAPVGPGVYEVRHMLTGRILAFGHATNVARALAELKVNGGVGIFARLLGRKPLVSRLADLEYRTCGAASRSEAKSAAHRLMGLRQNAWRRRAEFGWASLFPG